MPPRQAAQGIMDLKAVAIRSPDADGIADAKPEERGGCIAHVLYRDHVTA